jgi:DNA-binding beta-propeller fold protein YncE
MKAHKDIFVNRTESNLFAQENETCENLQLLNIKKVNFKPSGAAINPLTHELFIISSVNKALLITDKNGTIKRVYPLSPRIYKQPEGIAFTSKGDLLISNEGSDEGSANIQVIKYKKIAK